MALQWVEALMVICQGCHDYELAWFNPEYESYSEEELIEVLLEKGWYISEHIDDIEGIDLCPKCIKELE